MPVRAGRLTNGNGDNGPLSRIDRHLKNLAIDPESEIKPAPGRTRDDPVFNPGSPRTEEKILRGQRLLGDLKKGGTIKKTGIYKLHKGEKVIPARPVARRK